MIVYSVKDVWIDLWCDDGGCAGRAAFRSSSRREAAKKARALGWRVKGKTALCPKHRQIASDHRQHEHARRG